MNTETLASSSVGKRVVRFLAGVMESRWRYRFFNPSDILSGVDNLAGQSVLEIGCGTGYFTVPTARIIGDQGSLVAMDILAESVELVSKRVQAAGLHNVRAMKGDALTMTFEAGSFHVVTLFGVIPAPMIPLSRLLAEIHRVLKPQGTLAVWPPVPGWLPQSILKTGLFSLSNKRYKVYNFKRT